MSQFHLDELRKALTRRGWGIVNELPGDDYKISGSWEIRRSTKSSTLFIDFDGFDDMQCRPLTASYACRIRGHPSLAIYFGRSRKTWNAALMTFLAGVDSLSGPGPARKIKRTRSR
jgi:hypothetical protein